MTDGRQINSLGATLREVQDELYKFGASIIYVKRKTIPHMKIHQQMEK